MAQRAFSIEDGNLQSRSIVTTRKRVYSDLDLTFSRAPNNDVYKKTDAAAVKQAVKNILLTNFLEKPFNSDFGGNLNGFLFNLDTEFDAEAIEDNVTEAIRNNETRVRVLDVTATVNSSRNDVRVTVIFQIINTLQNVTLEVSLARLR